jgi:FtsZ-binding cell division protein ZapB
MDEDLKLANRLLKPSPVSMTIPSNIAARAAEAITRLHAEIEALKSDVSDLVRAGSDEATENERLVKERDEWKERALDRGVVGANWMDRAIAAEAQRDAALKALKEADEALCDYACATDDVPCKRSASQCNEMCGEPAVFARQAIARASRTLEGGQG